ncbi:flavin-containing monooxygenase FMO GS-OX-like 4 [Elaeis guineensis]|uniref:flavin-containing monooxygenase FMO GS-OX-like 4 n=1 Tax=Elaeis guineensis var. tenera TaxID=51953 RepID=UPI003C6D0E01
MPSSSPLAPSASFPPVIPRRVAVIGAGAGGLAAARELRREGHRVVVFERGGSVGGTWVYTSAVESDPLGLDPARKVVHSSLYDSLRTNLPRESMGFLDYPFVSRHRRGDGGGGGGEGDPRRFPGRREVLRYLEDFARDFDLYRLVRFWTEVGQVEREDDGRWAVRSRRVSGGDGGEESEVYDAVVICNGHFTEPRVAEIPGVDAWPGKQMHSHNYRVPEPFIDQVVVIIGSSASAHDISRDISSFAKEVHIASRSASDGTPTKLPGYGNVWLHSMVESAHEDGHVVFQDGSSVHVDVIMHCTGYRYHFPFLETNGIVNVDDNRVGPLYKHIFPPELAPCLSFIGIPWKVIPFPMFELQSKWVAGVLSGRIALPTQEEMMEDVKAFYLQMEVAGWPKRYTHNFSGLQFEYNDWLAHECGYPPMEGWRKQMYAATTANKIALPESYRDEWNDDHLVAEADRDFQKFL